MIPTADQLVSYAVSLKGMGHAPNDATRWYYGNDTDANYCEIFVCYCLHHFGNDALALFGGKGAWVPDLYLRGGHNGALYFPKSHARELRKADVVTYDFNHNGESEHTGYYIKEVDSSTFLAIEGNTTAAGIVAVRQRYYSDVSGFVRLNLAKPDPSAFPGQLFRYVKGKAYMSGAYEKWIQSRLRLYGHNIATDGIYGPKTAEAVKEFQNSHGLSDDGIVGPKTWAALKKDPSKN